jgi:hypothetical protein
MYKKIILPMTTKQHNTKLVLGMIGIFVGLFSIVGANTQLFAQSNSTDLTTSNSTDLTTSNSTDLSGNATAQSESTTLAIDNLNEIKASLDQAISELENDNVTGALNHIDTADDSLGDVEDQLENDSGNDDSD